MNPIQHPLQEIGGGGAAAGSSNVTVVNPPGGTVNTIPKWTAATVLGNSAITDDGTSVTTTNRQVLIQLDDANNAAVINVLTLRHSTSGAAANGIGVSQTFVSEDNGGGSDNIGQIDALLTSVVAGSEVSRIDIRTRAIGDGGTPAIVASFSQALISQAAAETTTVTDAATNTTTDIQTLIHLTSGAAVADFGAGILFQLEDNGGATENAGRFSVKWLDASAASEDSAWIWSNRVAGAALSQTMMLGNGLTVGNSATSPGAGNILLAGGLVQVFSSAYSILATGQDFNFTNSNATATARVRIQVSTTAAGTGDRVALESTTAPTAGYIVGAYSAANRYFGIGWGGDIAQLFADTGAGLTGTVSNTPTGRSEFAVGTAVYQLVSNRCVAASRVYVTLETIQGATVLQGVVPAAGSFTVTITAVAAVAVIRFNWMICNNL